jgi:NAD(P)-dependent dehydrogenase (short-subunit alcohol dehydrogenase family)
MQTTGGGAIFNVLRPETASPHAAVRAARAGLLGLTAALAAEWEAFGVTVETVEAASAVEEVLARYRALATVD